MLNFKYKEKWGFIAKEQSIHMHMCVCLCKGCVCARVRVENH